MEQDNAQVLIKGLRSAEERFRSFLANSSEQLWCVEFDDPIPLALPMAEQIGRILDHGRYVEANQAFADVYGASVEEVVGWPLERTLPRGLPSTQEFLEAVVESGYRMTDAESVEVDVDGNELIILNNFYPAIVDGQVVRVWGTARDVTERRKIEEAIRLRSTAIETMRDGCVIVDAKAEGMPIVYANEQFALITKYPSSEILGRNCRFLQGPETSPEVVQEIRAAIARKEGFQGELLNYRKDGKAFWNYLRITPVIGTDGAVTHYVGIQSDITGRKRAGETIRDQNRALKAEIRTREGAQRELENLTVRLIEFGETERRRLARDLHDDISQRVAAFALETARAATTLSGSPDRALQDLRQISESLSDLAADTQELSRQLHPRMLEDLGLERAIRSECRRFEKREGLEIDVSLDECGEVSDETSLCAYRILQESLANICKHAQASRVAVELEDGGDGISLGIRDDGVGFDGKSGSPEGALGLVSMAERTRNCRGVLKVDSAPGAGTRIRVTLPKSAQVAS